MNEILFSALFIVCGFNLLQQFNTKGLMREYHIIDRIKYINEDGMTLNEPINEPIYKPAVPYLDIQEMIYNWNKSRPILD
jgi:hypothetical protein